MKVINVLFIILFILFSCKPSESKRTAGGFFSFFENGTSVDTSNLLICHEQHFNDYFGSLSKIYDSTSFYGLYLFAGFHEKIYELGSFQVGTYHDYIPNLNSISIKCDKDLNLGADGVFPAGSELKEIFSVSLTKDQYCNINLQSNSELAGPLEKYELRYFFPTDASYDYGLFTFTLTYSGQFPFVLAYRDSTDGGIRLTKININP